MKVDEREIILRLRVLSSMPTITELFQERATRLTERNAMDALRFFKSQWGDTQINNQTMLELMVADLTVRIHEGEVLTQWKKPIAFSTAARRYEDLEDVLRKTGFLRAAAQTQAHALVLRKRAGVKGWDFRESTPLLSVGTTS
jgi:hypothetical protein